MRNFLTLLVLFSLFLLIKCENPLENRVDELERQISLQEEEQQKKIDSLIVQLLNQQEIIDGLIIELRRQQSVIDSLGVGQSYQDSMINSLKEYIDNLIDSQQEIIDMLIANQPDVEDGSLRIDSVQMCWGASFAKSSGTTVTFSKDFKYPPKVFMTQQSKQNMIGVTNITYKSARFFVNELYQSVKFSYLAIGLWNKH